MPYIKMPRQTTSQESPSRPSNPKYQNTRGCLRTSLSGGTHNITDSRHLIFSIDRWLVPPKPKRITQAFRDAFSSIPRQWSFTYIRNNAQLIFFHILFFAINLGLIISRLVGFRNTLNVDGSRNWSIMIARAAGQGALNINCDSSSLLQASASTSAACSCCSPC